MTPLKTTLKNKQNEHSEKFRKINEQFNFSESEKYSEKFPEKYHPKGWSIFIFRGKFLRSLFFTGAE
jgi:hypothetical protein